MMKIRRTLFLPGLALISLLTGFNVYAADPSICNPGSDIVLHSNGSLKSCQLKYDFAVNNIHCKSDYPVNFYTNGKLESCVLSAAATIAGNKCSENGEITFYTNGNLKSCVKPD
jgi:hypothetical protein